MVKKKAKKVVAKKVEEPKVSRMEKIEKLDNILTESVYSLSSGSTDQMIKFNKKIDAVRGQIIELI